MKKILSTTCLLLTLGLAATLQAEPLFKSDFDTSLAQAGQPPKLMSEGDARLELVSGLNDPAAATAAKADNMALMLQGPTGEPHSWKPAADISFPDASEGTMTISFLIRNVSLDVGTFGVQVAQKSPVGTGYQVYQSMIVYIDHLKITGSGRHFFKEITAGTDSKWHKVVWSFPLPATSTGTPTLINDGINQGAISLEQKEGVTAVNTVRLWLTSKRTDDIKFLVDDIEVEVTP